MCQITYPFMGDNNMNFNYYAILQIRPKNITHTWER